MKVIGTILRWFTLGTIAGILIAPRAGHETRQMISDKFTQLVEGVSGEENAAPQQQEQRPGNQATEVRDIAL